MNLSPVLPTNEKILFYYFMCMAFGLHVCLRIMCMPGAQEGQRRASELLEVKLQIFTNCLLGARN